MAYIPQDILSTKNQYCSILLASPPMNQLLMASENFGSAEDKSSRADVCSTLNACKNFVSNCLYPQKLCIF